MDEDLLRRERILRIILIGSIIMLTALDGIILFYSLKEGGNYAEMSFESFSLLPLFFVLLYVLSRRGHSVIASYFLVGAYFVSNGYAAYRWGVMLQVVILAYALIIIMATILRGTKLGFITTTAIAAYIIPLWYAQFHKIILVQKQQLRALDGIVFAILYALIMVIAWLYDHEIEKSLLRARTSEMALTSERDQLEITVQKRTEELKQSQFEKIEQLNRFAELGQLSSGLFHDIFNLLEVLSLRSQNDTDAPTEQIQKTTKQINDFTQAVKKQLHQKDQDEEFFLIQSIGHVIQLLSYKAIKEKVQIVIDSDDSRDINNFGDAFKFHQIVMNLLLNAIESFECLETGDVRKRIVMISVREKNGQAILVVKDNGCGMTPAVQSNIFEYFFTTKDPSKGTGIGLATIKKIVEQDLQGGISTESQFGVGSTFTIVFPLNYASISNNHPKKPRLH